MIGDFEFLYGNKTKADLSADAATDVFGGEIGNLVYLGDWDASTNTPELIDGEGEDGNYYVVVVEGVADLGSGPINFLIGNIVKYAGDLNVWTLSALINKEVLTVNYQAGNVLLSTDEIWEGTANLYWTPERFDAKYDERFSGSDTDGLSEGSNNLYWTDFRFDERFDSRLPTKSIGILSDVDIETSPPNVGDLLMWDGTNYVPRDDDGVALRLIAITSEEDIGTGENRIPEQVWITQADYDALTPPEPDKMYVIRG